jgi:predicted DNA-binding transcriptional regulator YafY
MPKFKPQYRRLLYIDRKLREGAYPNCSILAAGWEVSTKTIQRDIDYLKWELDAPIDYHRARHGYYYTEESYRLPAINVSESDLFAICVAEKALEQYKGTPLYEKLASVFSRIQESLPEAVAVDPSWADARFSFIAEPAAKIDPGIWSAITRAIKDNRSIHLRHISPEELKQHTERDVDPYHLASYRGQWYLIALCHRSGKIRTFAVSRIDQAELLEQRFELPGDFSIDRLLGSHFGIMWGEEEYKVKIRFSRKVAPYIKERQWHPTQGLSEKRDGSLLLSFTTNHLNEVKDWILTWGPAARVLAPKELVGRMKRDLVAAADLYK